MERVNVSSRLFLRSLKRHRWIRYSHWFVEEIRKQSKDKVRQRRHGNSKWTRVKVSSQFKSRKLHSYQHPIRTAHPKCKIIISTDYSAPNALPTPLAYTQPNARHTSAALCLSTGRHSLEGCRCVIFGVLIIALSKVGPLGWQQLLHLLHAVMWGLLSGFVLCGT